MAGKRLDVLTVREYEQNGEKKSAWTRIGVAFQSKDGSGWDLILDALPMSGKVFMREPKARDNGSGSGNSGAPF